MTGSTNGAEDVNRGGPAEQAQLDFLRLLLPFARRIPSHDTPNDVMNALPPPREREADIFAIEWHDLAAGKAGKRCNLVSWAARQRLAGC